MTEKPKNLCVLPKIYRREVKKGPVKRLLKRRREKVSSVKIWSKDKEEKDGKLWVEDRM